MAFLNEKQLRDLGLGHCGKNVLISDRASIYGAQYIIIGDNSRIDDFCILSAGQGGITIGKHVHIGCYSSIIGRAPIEIGDFAGLSGRVSVYSSSDPYDGSCMTNPTVPEPYRKTVHEAVTIGRHCVIGSGSVVLPGAKTGPYTAFGAMSIIKSIHMQPGVYAGVPIRRISKRDAPKLREIEKDFDANAMPPHNNRNADASAGTLMYFMSEDELENLRITPRPGEFLVQCAEKMILNIKEAFKKEGSFAVPDPHIKEDGLDVKGYWTSYGMWVPDKFGPHRFGDKFNGSVKVKPKERCVATCGCHMCKVYFGER